MDAPPPERALTEPQMPSLPGRILDGQAPDANRVADIGKLITEYKSSRVGPEETKNLENLGNERNLEKQRAREEQKREFIRRLNSGRPLRD